MTINKEIIEGNLTIAKFFSNGKRVKHPYGFPGAYGYKFPEPLGWWNENSLKFHSSWDWLLPVWQKCTEIGLFMMTHGFERLWLEKEKEVENAIIRDFDCKKAAHLISLLIQWYNQQKLTHDH